jgi:hypothetical protein
MSGPVLAVRVAANVEELKRNLQDGVVNQVEVVRSSLIKMANAYDPQVLINKAGLTAAAIQQVGGASMLSADQQARANRVIDEGVAAFGRMGQQVPPGILALKAALDPTIQQQNMLGEKITITAAEMEQATGKTSGLRAAYHEFDNVLQAVGINIGPQAKGLLDVAEAAGHSTTALGPLATAGLVAGAAFAGWEIGRWIAGVLGLDEKIAHLASTVFGYGDVAAQTAAAKQDVINRAIAAGAPLTISYTAAVQFNAKAHQEAADAYEVSAQRMANAYKAVLALDEATRNEIIRAKEQGASEEAIQRHYQISADMLKVIIHQKELAVESSAKLKKATEEEAVATEKLNAQYREYNNWLGQRKMEDEYAASQQHRKEVAEGLRDAIFGYVRAQKEAADADAAVFTEQARIEKENQALIKSYQQAGAAAQDGNDKAKASAQGASGAYSGLAQQVTITADAIKEWLRLQVYSAKVNAILSESSVSTQSQRDRIAAIGIPDFATSSGGGSSSTSTVNFSPVINVNGGGNSQDIARAVSDALLNLYRTGAIPFPSPV